MKPDYPLLGLLARQPSSGYELGKWLRTEGIFLGRKASMSPADERDRQRLIKRMDDRVHAGSHIGRMLRFRA